MPSTAPSAPPGEATNSGPVPAHAERYYPYFDLLRIVLALAVVLHHEQVFGWARAGNLAVQVFFALSGWLIGGILQGTSRAGLARFWFNRATRIWIPYYAAVGILLALAAAREEIGSVWLRTAFHYATFTYNWFGYAQVEAGSAIAAAMPLRGTGHPFWSIGAEEQFYLVAPLLLVLAPARLGRSPLTWAALSLCAVAGDVYGAISLGVLASVLRSRHGDWHLAPGATAALAATALGAAGALVAGAPYHLAAPFLSVSIVLLLAREGRRSAAGAFLGGISYPLYLNHWIGMFAAGLLVKRHLVPAAVEPALACAIALAVAAAMFLAIDRPTMRRRGGWYTPRVGWALAAAGFVVVGLGLSAGLALGPLAPRDQRARVTSSETMEATKVEVASESSASWTRPGALRSPPPGVRSE